MYHLSEAYDYRARRTLQRREKESWKLSLDPYLQFPHEAQCLRWLDGDSDRSEEHGLCRYRGSQEEGHGGGQAGGGRDQNHDSRRAGKVTK